MAPGAEEALIPLWAADIRESVAEIRGLTGQIPGIITRLENLQANQVPTVEYLELKRKVEELTERDLTARSDWLEMRKQHPILWDERQQIKGAIKVWRIAVAVLGAAFIALSFFVLAHNAGITISVK